jgi:DMSO/TMAO reductase YedYZ molybdopterin-dependent catalytic subunit
VTKKIKRIPTFFHEFKGRPIPDIDLASYRLAVGGEVANHLELSLEEMGELLPVIETRRRFYCVNGWSLEAQWRGFYVADLLELAGALPGIPYLRAVSGGGYEDTSRIESLVKGRAMLVTHMDGEPLSPERGKPVRLMIFDKYQFRGVKAVARVEVVKDYRQGAWVKYGYTDASIQPFPHFAVDKGENLMPDTDVLDAGPDEI